MFIVALILGVFSCAVVASTYLLYVALVLKNRKTNEFICLIKQITTKPSVNEELPNVTVIIPMYNEEPIIAKKLQNITELDYPVERIQVLILDDCSTDRACEIAENSIRKLKLNGRIIKNSHRMGANASYNLGVANASSDLILRTDADITINADALRKAVRIISNMENIGGVTGMMVPVFGTNTAATSIERRYRNLFDQMSISESALHSTYPGGGGFTLIKKSVFSPIPINQGSTDGNISLSIIRNGFRHIYVPESFSFELVSKRLGDQMRQKVRRARRVIQSTIMNKDFLFNSKYHEFGQVIFPLRFAMFVICPFFVFAGILATFSLLLSYSPILAVSIGAGAVFVFFLGSKIKIEILSTITSVLAQQFYLLLGLFALPKKNGTWASIKRVNS